MTAGRQEEALAAQAQAAGEQERASRDDHAEQMHATISGSGEDTSDAGRSPDDGSVTWIGESSEP